MQCLIRNKVICYLVVCLLHDVIFWLTAFILYIAAGYTIGMLMYSQPLCAIIKFVRVHTSWLSHGNNNY